MNLKEFKTDENTNEKQTYGLTTTIWKKGTTHSNTHTNRYIANIAFTLSYAHSTIISYFVAICNTHILFWMMQVLYEYGCKYSTLGGICTKLNK